MSAERTPAELLVAAVKAGDLSKTASLLALHPDLRGRLNDPLPGLPFDATILEPAVRRQHREMIDLLLAAGADVNVKSHWWAGGFGMLDLADPALVPFLRERGAVMTINAAARLGLFDEAARLLAGDPSLARARGGDGQTPLHVASTVEMARLLLDHGAEIDALDVDHESTPAQYRIGDHADVVRFLVSRGCRADVLMAAALGDADLVRRLLDEAPERVRTSVSPEYFPMANPRAGGTIYIWTLGAHVTPHLVAHRRKHADVFELLMDRSPAPLALGTACRVGDAERAAAIRAAHPSVIGELSDRDLGAIVDAADANDTTAVRLLLQNGWPADVRDAKGVTPLHWAAWYGNVGMIRELLAHGAPTTVRERTYNGTPFDWAQHAAATQPNRRGDYAGAAQLLGPPPAGPAA